MSESVIMERVFQGGHWQYRVVQGSRVLAAGLSYWGAVHAVVTFKRVPRLLGVMKAEVFDGELTALRVNTSGL